MSNFEELSKFIPLSEKNLPALTTKSVDNLTPQDLKFRQPALKDLTKDKDFYEYEMTLNNGQPIVFMLSGHKLDIGISKMSKFGKERVEFKLDLTSNGVGQHALFTLAELIRCNIKEVYEQDYEVKSAMYGRRIAAMPWSHSYGRPQDIEVRARQSIFSCNLEVNAEALRRVIASNSGGEFECRVLVKTWMMRDKETGELKAGYKLHVQQVNAI